MDINNNLILEVIYLLNEQQERLRIDMKELKASLEGLFRILDRRLPELKNVGDDMETFNAPKSESESDNIPDWYKNIHCGRSPFLNHPEITRRTLKNIAVVNYLINLASGFVPEKISRVTNLEEELHSDFHTGFDPDIFERLTSVERQLCINFVILQDMGYYIGFRREEARKKLGTFGLKEGRPEFLESVANSVIEIIDDAEKLAEFRTEFLINYGIDEKAIEFFSLELKDEDINSIIAYIMDNPTCYKKYSNYKELIDDTNKLLFEYIGNRKINLKLFKKNKKLFENLDEIDSLEDINEMIADLGEYRHAFRKPCLNEKYSIILGLRSLVNDIDKKGTKLVKKYSADYIKFVYERELEYTISEADGLFASLIEKRARRIPFKLYEAAKTLEKTTENKAQSHVESLLASAKRNSQLKYFGSESSESSSQSHVKRLSATRQSSQLEGSGRD